MNFSTNKNSKAFSLIEMLLVLGVLAVLLVAAFVVYPRVRDASRVNAEVNNLIVMKAAVVNLFNNSGGSYAGLNTTVANQARVIPETMNGGNYASISQIKSTWGGDVTIGNVSAQLSVPYVVPGSRSFRIIYTKVPESICLGLVSASIGNFFKITVDSVDVINVNDGKLEFNPAIAAEACSKKENDQIAFYSL